MLSWWSCQSPGVHSCGPLNHPNSFCGGMFEFNAKLDADSLLYWLSHFECNGQSTAIPPWTCPISSECNGHTLHMLNIVYRPHWLVQWSRHCSLSRYFQFSFWLVKSLEDVALIPHNNNKEKKWTHWKPVILLRYNRELESQGKLPPQKLKRGEHKMLAYREHKPSLQSAIGRRTSKSND